MGLQVGHASPSETTFHLRSVLIAIYIHSGGRKEARVRAGNSRQSAQSAPSEHQSKRGVGCDSSTSSMAADSRHAMSIVIASFQTSWLLNLLHTYLVVLSPVGRLALARGVHCQVARGAAPGRTESIARSDAAPCCDIVRFLVHSPRHAHRARADRNGRILWSLLSRLSRVHVPSSRRGRPDL
jgi:hypothetical protein